MHILNHIVIFTVRGMSYLFLLLVRLFSVFSRDPPCPGPPLDSLLLIPATVLAEKIRRGELRSTVVVQAYISRIRQVNSALNAVVCDRFEDALREAKSVDDLVSSGSENEATIREKFPFLGVPFTVKEAFALQGMPNSSGLICRSQLRSSTDAVVVARLKSAGGIPLGVTNCSELCMWYESSNNVYGKTRNPYNPQHIVGGSSGGEGCILGAGGSVFGVGSDIGGSIRMPAFFNGIYGHKPTSGIVPNEGQFPDAQGCRTEFLCTGPMCRYASDLPAVLKVMAGDGIKKLSLDQEVSLRKLRFFSMENDGGSIFVSHVDKELVQAQRQLVEHLERELGVTVQPVSIYNLRYSFQIWSAMMSLDGNKGESFADLMSNNSSLWPSWELIKWMFGLSNHTLPAIGLALTEKLANLNVEGNARMVKKARNLRQEISSLLGDDGILIYPSHPKIAPRHNEPIAFPFNFAYTGIFNMLGVPVTQCPLGLSQSGLPLGIQLVASHYNDHLTLALAQYLEKTIGGWRPPTGA
ncbi:fatty-acid amide hydrolase 2 [Bombina bombina]|uniref:fatty-acid amide hydrolase 2 n=1 Tax=Bombina bombina TaxID=8345 RepID=UPI00235AC4AF|nr:fatty-acid amide hydrolase 2 [Bombina bombina]XP_053554904.1 fatty-acid amide hydrolase 2 [Bombina bombina]XP_053554905.1 fatty-acid amide hydrolase 2 [Bombina bombina]